MNENIIRDLRSEWDDALQAIETVLDERPGEHMREISHAVAALVRVRDRLIELDREQGLSPDARQHLNEINAMLSVVASLEYPLAGLHWQRVQLVRDGLARMLSDSADIA